MRVSSAVLVALLLAACGDAIVQTASVSPESPAAEATIAPSETAASTNSGETEPVVLPSETASPPSTSEEATPSPALQTTGETPGFFDSPAFRTERIPPKYTCDGIDVSPPLQWSVVNPDAVSEFAIVVTDSDAHDFTHWVVARIPGPDTGLDEGAGDPDAGNGLLQGQNGFGSVGYRGPCPPASTTHHYHFALYAFATAPDLSAAPTADEVSRAGGTPIVAFDALYSH